MSMTPFLYSVAQDLLMRFNNDLSRVVVVFPNKRARLFFDDYLCEILQRPLWLPTYITIDELFGRLSPYELIDEIVAVCKLYHIYKKHTETEESLDYFYGWGERILSDFNDIDKHLIDAQKLFVNIQALSEIDQKDYLTEEQIAEIKYFFKDWSHETNNEIKEKFTKLWTVMPLIYAEYKQTLFAYGSTFEGALCREVLERLETEPQALVENPNIYVFVGLNALSPVENRLLHLLKKNDKALFYWDYDVCYTQGENAAHYEAGTFIRPNLKNFPNALRDTLYDNLLSQPKEIVFAASSTESAQVRFATQWLKQHTTDNERKTAIILCNEELLQPLLHAIPENVETINITKGLPLAHTTAYAFAEKQLQNIRKSSSQDIKALLSELSLAIKEKAQELKMNKVRTSLPAQQIFDEMNAEAFFKVFTTVNQFINLEKEGALSVSPTTLYRLILQSLGGLSIPFHGEPAVGIQIMGLLETRNLDFDNILIIGANEGKLPQGAATNNSFIPYFIRRAFGLTTAEDRTAIAAFYFYRLIQRAKHVTMTYNSSTSLSSKGEMSRFMLQLLVDTNLPIRFVSIESSPQAQRQTPHPVKKTDEMLNQCLKLGPSALNHYLDCPLRFYYHQVAHLKEPDKGNKIMAPNTFGTLFHKAAELIYQPLAQQAVPVTADFIEGLLDNGGAALVSYVRQAFDAEEETHNVIIEEVIKMYLMQLLQYDKKQTPFVIKHLEYPSYQEVKVRANDRDYMVNVGGIIDRIDEVGHPHNAQVPLLRVVDYKTGGESSFFDSIEQLITPDKKRPGYIFQTFLYANNMVKAGYEHVAPALFYAHKSAGEDYTPYIKEKGKDGGYIYDFTAIAPDFSDALDSVLQAIFDKEKAFTPTVIEEHCAKCPYHKLCGK